MTGTHETERPRPLVLSRLAGQVLKGLFVGALVVLAVVEIYAATGAATFQYQGF